MMWQWCFLQLVSCALTVRGIRLRRQPFTSSTLKNGYSLTPGDKLEITPANAVAQLNDEGRPIKFLPIDIEGSWQYSPVNDDVKRDMNRPKEHYWDSGLHDPDRGGVNIIPGTVISLEGHDYKQGGTPSLPPSKAEMVIPVGNSLGRQPAQPPINLNRVPVNVQLPKSHPEAIALGVNNPTFDTRMPSIPPIETPNIPGLPNIPPAKRGTPTFQLAQQPRPPLNVPSLPATNSAGWDLSALASLLGFQFSGFNFNFPQPGIWSPKFPHFDLSASLPNLPGFTTILSKFGGNVPTVTEDDPVIDHVCARDYRGSRCPIGWHQTSNFCMAPTTYNGACARLMDFSRYTIRGLSIWASQCKAPWPCVSPVDCPAGRDYSSVCPDGWILKSGGCAASKKYKGNCQDPLYNLEKFTQLEKENFESACNVSWPCKTQPCIQDYDVPCPVEYRLDNNRNVCLAVDPRRVSCPTTPLGVLHWDVQAKKTWSAKCEVAWPCKKTFVDGRWMGCKRNYTAVCPEGWRNVADSGLCEAPAYYTAASLPSECPMKTKQLPRIAFDHCSVAQKETFAKLCAASWPCTQDDVVSTATVAFPCQGCPLGFHVVSSSTPGRENEFLCESDAEVKRAPCDDTRNFTSLTFQELEALTHICGFQWNTTQKPIIDTTGLFYGSDISVR